MKKKPKNTWKWIGIVFSSVVVLIGIGIVFWKIGLSQATFISDKQYLDGYSSIIPFGQSVCFYDKCSKLDLRGSNRIADLYIQDWNGNFVVPRECDASLNPENNWNVLNCEITGQTFFNGENMRGIIILPKQVGGSIIYPTNGLNLNEQTAGILSLVIKPDIKAEIINTPSIFTNSIHKTKVEVTNNFINNIPVAVFINFKTSEILGSSIEKTFNKNTTLPLGKTIVEFDTPTNLVGDLNTDVQVFVIVKHSDYMMSKDSNKFYNEYLKPIYPISKLTYLVNPQPLVIKQDCSSPEFSCPIGYSCLESGGNHVCGRTDVQEINLTCQIVGCPPNDEVLGLYYSCISSGICAETVFQTKTINNTIIVKENVTCEPPLSKVVTGEFAYCVRTEFVDKLTQCKIPADCQTPCSGITADCNLGLCSYSGTCKPIEIGCKDFGCPTGSHCDQQRNVCMINVKPVEKSYLWWWVFGGIVLLILFIFVIYFLIKRKR